MSEDSTSKNTSGSENQHKFSNVQPISAFIALYVLSGEIYLYYWFYKNLKNFKEHKNLNSNSFTLVWWFLGCSCALSIGYIFLYALMGDLAAETLDPSIEYTYWLLFLLVDLIFIYLLLKKTGDFIRKSKNEIFSLNQICALYFAVGVISIIIPETPFFSFLMLIPSFFTAMIVSWVQKDLNRYWAAEQPNLAIRKLPSMGEGIVLGVCLTLWILVYIFLGEEA